MSWEKIENHLFEKHCVEGEDKELCNLMEEHDAEIRAKAIDEFAEELRGNASYIRLFGHEQGNYVVTTECIDRIAEQMKGGAV